MDLAQFQPRLCSVQINRYRSIRSTKFEPTSQLSVLIGPNGSGKTNLLRAIILLKAEIRRRYSVSEKEDVLAPVSLKAGYEFSGHAISYSMELSTAPGEGNQEEIASAKEVWSGNDPDGAEWSMELPASMLYLRRSLLRASAIPRAGMEIELPEIEIFKTHPHRLTAINEIAGFNRRLRYYSASHFTDPGKCPSTFEVEGDDEIVDEYSTRGPHRSFVYGLYKLWKTEKDAFDAFLDIVGKEGIGLVNDIKFRQYPLSSNEVRVREGTKVLRRKRRRTLVVPVVQIRRSTVTFSQLSDGTFKSLALLFNLFSRDWSMLLLEEPEVCVHHGLLSSIVEIVMAKAKERQIVMSTHSELVLDLVEPTMVFPVRLGGKGTTVSRLDESLSQSHKAALVHYLQTEGNLGEYWKHGGFGS